MDLDAQQADHHRRNEHFASRGPMPSDGEASSVIEDLHRHLPLLFTLPDVHVCLGLSNIDLSARMQHGLAFVLKLDTPPFLSTTRIGSTVVHMLFNLGLPSRFLRGSDPPHPLVCDIALARGLDCTLTGTVNAPQLDVAADARCRYRTQTLSDDELLQVLLALARLPWLWGCVSVHLPTTLGTYLFIKRFEDPHTVLIHHRPSVPPSSLFVRRCTLTLNTGRVEWG